MFKNRQFEFEYLYWKAGFFQSFPVVLVLMNERKWQKNGKW